MRELAQYYAIVSGLIMAHLLFKAVSVVVGLLVLSAVGLLIGQHYWHAMLMLTVAVLFYDGAYWLLVGRWRR
jgi:hypothetical protein